MMTTLIQYRKTVSEMMTIWPQILGFLLQDTLNLMFHIFSQDCLEELAEEVSVLLAITFANTQSEKIPKKNFFLAYVFPKEKEDL